MEMPVCPSCGKTTNDDVSFCPYCGVKMPAIVQAPAPAPAPAPAQYQAQPIQPVQKSRTIRNVAIIIVVALVVIGIVVVAQGIGSNSTGSKNQSSTNQNNTYVPTQHNISLVSGSVAVNAGSYVYYQFSVPGDATNAAVTGSFTAAGGSGNDIIVYVMTNTDFTNWQNGHSSNTYYNSGQETTENINAGIPAGQSYVIVFDNQFSTLSSKTVDAQISLTYVA
jgi:hypothetical protein